MIDALAFGLMLLCFKMLYLNNQPMADMNMSTLLVILIVVFYLRLFANVLQYHANSTTNMTVVIAPVYI